MRISTRLARLLPSTPLVAVPGYSQQAGRGLAHDGVDEPGPALAASFLLVRGQSSAPRLGLPIVALLSILGAPAPAAAQGYQLSKIALSGETAPDSGGGTFTASAMFPSTHMNAARQVPFTASLTGGSVGSGLWMYSSGVLGSLVLEGQPAPIPAVPGATYGPFPAILPSCNSSGDVVFEAQATLGGGLFIDAGGTQSAVVLMADTLPGTGGGSFFSARPAGFCCPFSALALNDAADIAFFALVSSGLVDQGIFTGSAGALSAVALPGDAAPATGGGSYASFGAGPIISLNAGGEVAFRAELSGGSVSEGIFIDANGSDRAVALQGDAAPGAAGGTYFRFDGNAFSACSSLNDSGDVAFHATLNSLGSESGIFVASGGTDRVVARTGDAAPGSGGELFTTLISACSLNSFGDIAFIGRDSGLGGTSEALYVTRYRALQRVVGVGDLAPGTGGATFTGFVGSGLPLAMVTINDTGDVAFMGTTSAGAEGLFLAIAPPLPPLPLPLPALSAPGAMLLGLTLAASFLLVRRSWMQSEIRRRVARTNKRVAENSAGTPA